MRCDILKMYHKNMFNKKRELAVFLRGGPGVGKTTLAEALSKKIPFSAKIDIDDLRYMIKGGCVASKSNLKPYDFQQEYFRQCRLGDQNAFALARNFLNAGFIPIIAGLNGGESALTFYYLKNPECMKWYPEQEILLKELQGIKIVEIVLDASPLILVKRFKNKGYNDETIDFVLKQRDLFLKLVSKNPTLRIIDTSNANPEKIAETIINEWNLQYFF